MATRSSRRDEVVVERVFDEERNAEKQREAANPRETFHAHELFPVDFRRWRRAVHGEAGQAE